MNVSALLAKSNKSSGQAVLLLLLGLAVVLTVVLSIASRSVTDVSITTIEEESSQAFSAAEAGIESFLSSGSTVSGNLTENVGFIVQSNDLGSGNYIDFAQVGTSYKSGEIATLWFVSHKDDDPTKMTCTIDKPCFSGTSFNLCWGSVSNDIPALEVAVYYGDRNQIFNGNYSSLKVKRYAFDPVSNRSSGFASVSNNVVCQGYSYGVTVDSLPSDLIFARIRFIYNSTPQSFAVAAPVNQSFPSQGRLISSLGTAGQSSRRIEVVDLYRVPPSIFESSVISIGGGLEK